MNVVGALHLTSVCRSSAKRYYSDMMKNFYHLLFLLITLTYTEVHASDVNVTHYNAVSSEDIKTIGRLPCTAHVGPVGSNRLWSCAQKFFPKSALLFGSNATLCVVCTVKGNNSVDLLQFNVDWMARYGKNTICIFLFINILSYSDGTG